MCGITGIVSSNMKDIGRLLVKCGKKLTYRGYDSVGVATVNNGVLDLRKDVGTVEEVDEKYKLSEMKGSYGIVQLRWATYGAPTRVNAQPHIGCTDDIFGAHNGNIHNYNEYRLQLIDWGHTIRSWNDGEICVHAVEHYYNKTGDMIKAMQLASKDLKGAFALAVALKNEPKIYAMKMGSSLVAGVGKDIAIVSSDLPSILPVTNKVVYLEDGEMVILTPGKVEVRKISDGSIVPREPVEAGIDPESAEKGGYPHFMIKEINEQATIAKNLYGLLESKVDDEIISYLNDHSKVYMVASGSSLNASYVGAHYFGDLAKKVVIPVISGNFETLYGKTIDDDSLAILVSQSGETKDVINVLNLFREKDVGKTLGVLNVIGSTLMFRAHRYIPMGCGYEISVPATKTYFSQTMIFAYLAAKLGMYNGNLTESEGKEFLRDLELKLPKLVQDTITKTQVGIVKLTDSLLNIHDLYTLGYGYTYGVAREGALKIKEICYVHCEGMYSSEFKHGPLSIVTPGYPIIYVTAPDDAWMMINHISEATCRGARAIIVGEHNKDLKAYASLPYDFIEVPTAGQRLNPLISVIPLQLLSYHLSIKKGIDPDFPRNLSKTITVD